MASTTKVSDDNVDYRLLNRLSNLVICCRCLRRGKVTPVPQVISDRHRLTNECPDCRQESVSRYTSNRALGKLLTLTR
ncbi:MAG TPA: hypothetical protein PKH39_09250 [Woeseiaceae bacterium]|nr:hypothetical protein [Woeseiaceae bacterium]